MSIPLFISTLVPDPANAQSKSCPLTDTQTAQSIEAFAPIASFLSTEPRCVNCHGGVNPFIKETGLDPGNAAAPSARVAHGGGLIVRQNDKTAEGVGLIESECQDCHNSMAPRRDGSKSVWMTAPDFLSFVNKDATTLCKQIKRTSHDAADFIGHLTDDNGGNNFTGTSYNGDRALDHDQFGEIPAAPPSISHEALLQLGKNWVTAMGGEFKGDESCGCEYKHTNWSGQIHFTLDIKGDEGQTELQDWSYRTFRHVTITLKDGVGRAASRAEVKNHGLNRHRVAQGGGKVSLEKDNSADENGTVIGASDATVQVQVGEKGGSYQIAASWTPVTGNLLSVSCNRETCTTTDLPLYTVLDAQTAISGTVNDTDHLQGSRTDFRERLGRSQKGVYLLSVSWDLTRSDSK
jgi:hypothetical protein